MIKLRVCTLSKFEMSKLKLTRLHRMSVWTLPSIENFFIYVLLRSSVCKLPRVETSFKFLHLFRLTVCIPPRVETSFIFVPSNPKL